VCERQRVCACVSVKEDRWCVCERQRLNKREREREGGREGERAKNGNRRRDLSKTDTEKIVFELEKVF